MKDLQVFDELKADIATFVGPVHKLRVMDFKSSAIAVDHGRKIQGLLKEVEARRDGLVRPLNEQVKTVNEYAREIKAPLEAAKRHLDAEVGAFAAETRRLKAIEDARIEAERRREEARIEAEAQAKREALEADALEGSVHPIFGNLDDAEAKELEHQTALINEEEAQAKQRAAAAAATAKYDAGRQDVRGVRMVWDFEVTDINQIPDDFVVKTPNKTALLAMARAGKDVPGVHFFKKPSVSFGENTYVPREALETERSRERTALPRASRRTPGTDVQPSRREASAPRGRSTSGRRS